MIEKKRLIEKVNNAYYWLDTQIKNNIATAQFCNACGACCNFAEFDHRLYLTTPELIYLKMKIGSELKPMKTSSCPYIEKGRCSIYANRFAGCRIFHCKADAEFQSQLSESVVKSFKAICADFQVPYHYMELSTALNNPPANTYR